MKKLIIGMTIALALVANAKTTLTIGTNEVDAIQYATAFSTGTVQRVDWLNGAWTQIDKPVLKQCDEIMAAKTKFAPFTQTMWFPNCAMNGVETEIKTAQPEGYAFAKQYVQDRIDGKAVTATAQKQYQLFVFSMSLKSGQVSESQRKIVLDMVPAAAKATLRKQGKSFVDKDGISPIKPYVDAVQNALNAKKMVGFNAALKSVSLDYGFKYEEYIWADEKVNALKEEIFNGDIEFTQLNQNILRTQLGVDEYNAFVKLYNEGE